jgi:hypothetical protein
VYSYNGLQNGETGYGVCDQTVGLGGCTADLAALMCEAYNKQLVKNGAKNQNGFCVGFLLTESTIIMGENSKKSAKYQKTHDHDILLDSCRQLDSTVVAMPIKTPTVVTLST